MSPEQIVRNFWKLMQTNDFENVGKIFLHDEFQLYWPQSSELICGRDNFASINSAYPAKGKWKFILNNIVAQENQVVTDVSVTDGDICGRAITFSEIYEDKIIKQTEFWPDDFEAPVWREKWVTVEK